MRKRVLSALLAVVLLGVMALPAGAASFQDVDEDADYAPAAEYLSSIGVMVGDENGNFNPDRTVTRAEMAAIVCRVVGQAENLPSDDRFPDVPVGHWANGYVSKAAELGVVNGYDNGNFGPADTVTYEQAVTMIVRAIGLEDDAQMLGGYPEGYLSVASNRGYTAWLNAVLGEKLVRWQVAVMLYDVPMNI